MAGATDVLGGTYTPHCAAIHPARLAARAGRCGAAGRGIGLSSGRRC